jgi:hypothetical protein
MSQGAAMPRPIELPRCAYCPAYASERLVLPEGWVLYVCEDHYDAWVATQDVE